MDQYSKTMSNESLDILDDDDSRPSTAKSREGDIQSLSDIPDEGWTLQGRPSCLEVEPPEWSPGFKPPPAYSSAPYSSGDSQDNHSEITMIDDILVTPSRSEMGTQTPRKPRLTPINDQRDLKSMEQAQPIPSQILVQDKDPEKESWLQIDVSEPSTYKIERLQGPDQISIGPLDQTGLAQPLETSRNLKFLPLKYVSENYPDSIHEDNIMGAILDGDTGKIFTIECSRSNLGAETEEPKPETEEEETISWCSIYIILRIVGLILVLAALLAIVLTTGSESSSNSVQAVNLQQTTLIATLSSTIPVSTTTLIPISTTSESAFQKSLLPTTKAQEETTTTSQASSTTGVSMDTDTATRTPVGVRVPDTTPSGPSSSETTLSRSGSSATTSAGSIGPTSPAPTLFEEFAYIHPNTQSAFAD